MLDLLLGFGLASLIYVWVKTQDKNVLKIQKIFEASGLKANDQYPMFSKRKGDVYLYRLPTGMSFDQIKTKLQVFKDAFPDKAVDISYKHALRIVITDEIPDKVELPLFKSNGWRIPLGKSIERIIWHDFSKYPHMLVAGMTRYGKSVLLGLIITLLLKAKPNAIRLVLIDLKGGLELNHYSKVKQSQGFAKSSDEAIEQLNKVKDEIEKRQKVFLENGYKKIDETNYDRVFIIVDEAAQLVSYGVKGEEGKKLRECERLLSYIAQIGAGMGFHLIYATQYPTLQTLPQQVKANCDATISFRLRNSTASRVVFDETEKSEKLPLIRGRAIYRTDKDVELQVFYMDEKQINEVIDANRRETNESPIIKDVETREDTVIFR